MAFGRWRISPNNSRLPREALLGPIGLAAYDMGMLWMFWQRRTNDALPQAASKPHGELYNTECFVTAKEALDAVHALCGDCY